MIYLDNAATTFPKPDCVWREMERAVRVYGGNPGRSAHRPAAKAAEVIYETREAVASLIGAASPENVVFTLNATYALNLAIQGIRRPDDHILISDIEHNAVLRPVHASGEHGYGIYRVTHGDATRTLTSIRAHLRPSTRILIANHQSNLCGITSPIREIGRFCRQNGIIFMVDASQSLGHLPIHVERDFVDVLCAPGHKGLYGPQGCGILWVRPGVPIAPLIAGGSGVDSLSPTMPALLPEALEAGTPPTPAIAGLREGIRFVQQIGIGAIHRKETSLCHQLRQRLSAISDVTVHDGGIPDGNVLLFNIRGHSSEQVAEYLNERGICVRPGYHCCPLGHKKLGTYDRGGVRAGFGWFNTESDADRLYEALKQL